MTSWVPFCFDCSQSMSGPFPFYKGRDCLRKSTFVVLTVWRMTIHWFMTRTQMRSQFFRELFADICGNYCSSTSDTFSLPLISNSAGRFFFSLVTKTAPPNYCLFVVVCHKLCMISAHFIGLIWAMCSCQTLRCVSASREMEGEGRERERERENQMTYFLTVSKWPPFLSVLKWKFATLFM